MPDDELVYLSLNQDMIDYLVAVTGTTYAGKDMTKWEVAADEIFTQLVEVTETRPIFKDYHHDQRPLVVTRTVERYG